MRYKVTAETRDRRGYITRGHLWDGDCVVATIRRNAGPYRYSLRFGSDRAAARFDDFCDSLSRAETVEALDEGLSS